MRSVTVTVTHSGSRSEKLKRRQVLRSGNELVNDRWINIFHDPNVK